MSIDLKELKTNRRFIVSNISEKKEMLLNLFSYAIRNDLDYENYMKIRKEIDEYAFSFAG